MITFARVKKYYTCDIEAQNEDSPLERNPDSSAADGPQLNNNPEAAPVKAQEVSPDIQKNQDNSKQIGDEPQLNNNPEAAPVKAQNVSPDIQKNQDNSKQIGDEPQQAVIKTSWSERAIKYWKTTEVWEAFIAIFLQLFTLRIQFVFLAKVSILNGKEWNNTRDPDVALMTSFNLT